MDQKQKNLFTDYYQLRNEVDIISKKLENKHSKNMECKGGCDMCCMDYSIFPVEFYSIINELTALNFKDGEINQNKLQKDSCAFLKDRKCTIYTARPIICRTHGLPLLYANDEGDWELSACELNFTKFNFGDFTIKNTFPQDKFNSKLFLLNKEFISDFQEKKFSEFDLIPIKNLVKHLINN